MSRPPKPYQFSSSLSKAFDYVRTRMTYPEYHKAVAVAKVAHAGAFRKYTGEPYVTHPLAVSQLVSHLQSDRLMAAAVLHDVFEDTDYPREAVVRSFDYQTVLLVDAVTDNPQVRPRAVRLKETISRVLGAGCDAQTLKLADRTHNLSSVLMYDPKFSEVYLPESLQLYQAFAGACPVVRGRLLTLLVLGSRQYPGVFGADFEAFFLDQLT